MKKSIFQPVSKNPVAKQPIPRSPNQREGESYMSMQLRMLNEKWAAEGSTIRVIPESP